MKAIQTRFLGPTNTEGARIKAWAEGVPSKFFYYEYENDGTANHHIAAQNYACLLKWDKDGVQIITGSLPNGDYCHVFTSV